MKILVTALAACLSLNVFANILTDVKKIECETEQTGDHFTITPNVFSHAGVRFAAVTGHYINSSGRTPKKTIFYEVKKVGVHNGLTHIQLRNNNTHFQNDAELNLFTEDFVEGTLAHFVFQPGIGGYGPLGIPGSVSQKKIFQCQFKR